MRIILQTLVKQNPTTVFAGFTKELFLKLAPPFPPVRLLRFDGSQAGDIVELELNFLFFKNTWQSLITTQNTSPEEIFFIDEGKKLPFFLRFWHHKHRIVTSNTGSIIIDEITYKSPFKILDYLLYPMMYAQFAYRKPIYKKVFGKV
jgi:ligand-binding SRPBCC domain-containing protein